MTPKELSERSCLCYEDANILIGKLYSYGLDTSQVLDLLEDFLNGVRKLLFFLCCQTACVEEYPIPSLENITDQVEYIRGADEPQMMSPREFGELRMRKRTKSKTRRKKK